MMNIYTSEEMRRYEEAAVAAGTSFLQLMENAGQGAAADLLRRLPQSGRALLVCGKGNNGGDGLVIARVLAQHGWQADVVFVLGENLSELAECNRSRLHGQEGIRLMAAEDWAGRLNLPYQVVVDGIFGTGFNGTLPEAAAHACRVLNGLDGLKVALDIPTGLNGDSGEACPDALRADLTYTFAAFKPGHFSTAGKALSGEIVQIDIV